MFVARTVRLLGESPASFLTLVREWLFCQPWGPGRCEIPSASRARESSEKNAEDTRRELSEKVTVALPFALVGCNKSVIVHLITCPFKVPSLPGAQGQETGLPWRALTLAKELDQKSLWRLIYLSVPFYFLFPKFYLFPPWIQEEHMV